MFNVPRFAVGVLRPEAQSEPMLWALLGALRQAGMEAQAFTSRCVPVASDGGRVITGRWIRQLDSWVMSRPTCLRAFQRGVDSASCAIVCGHWTDQRHSESADSTNEQAGGTLEQLSDWLALPRIAIIDARQIANCRFPRKPDGIEAVLLDQAPSHEAAIRLQTEFDAQWSVPTLGWLTQSAVRDRATTHVVDRSIPRLAVCRELAEQLAPTLALQRLLRLGQRRALPAISSAPIAIGATRKRLQVAVAYDEGFSCHSPETWGLLEAAGAVVQDFSPLRGEALPDGADLVMLGCGDLEPYLQTLSANHCLKQSLRCYAASGGRIYAEGAGLAYLCRQVALPDGQRLDMSGLLPAVARRTVDDVPLEPVEVVFGASCWLADVDTSLRGYRTNAWQIEPVGSMMSYARSPRQRLDFVGRGNVIGSRVLTNFAAQPQLLRRFFDPLVSVAMALRS